MRKASILIVALWTVALLSSLTIVLGYNLRQKVKLLKVLEEKSALRYFVEGEIRKIIMGFKRLQDKESPVYLRLPLGVFGEEAVNFKENIFGENRERTFLNLRFYWDIFDEERKLNINYTKMSTLKRLFELVLDSSEMEAQELAAAIQDWRDADSFLSLPLGSAEDPYYRALSHPYEAKDAYFEVIEELLLVKGISPKIFDKVKDYLTVYGEGKVNINTAPKPVLCALDLSEDLVEKIINFRKGKDGVLGTDDDGHFDTPSNIIPFLEQRFSLTSKEVISLNNLLDEFVTTSDYFKVKILILSKDNSNFREINCVVDKEGKLLRWQE